MVTSNFRAFTRSLLNYYEVQVDTLDGRVEKYPFESRELAYRFVCECSDIRCVGCMAIFEIRRGLDVVCLDTWERDAWQSICRG